MKKLIKLVWGNSSYEDDETNKDFAQVLEYTFDGKNVIDRINIPINAREYFFVLNTKEEKNASFNGRVGLRVLTALDVSANIYREISDWVWSGEADEKLSYLVVKKLNTNTTWDDDIYSVGVCKNLDAEKYQIRSALQHIDEINADGEIKTVSPTRTIKTPSQYLSVDITDAEVATLKKNVAAIDNTLIVDMVNSKDMPTYDNLCINERRGQNFECVVDIVMYYDEDKIGEHDFLNKGYNPLPDVNYDITDDVDLDNITIYGWVDKTTNVSYYNYMKLDKTTFTDEDLAIIKNKVNKIYFGDNIEVIALTKFVDYADFTTTSDVGIDVKLPAKLKRIEAMSFYKIALNPFHFPDTLEYIGSKAFSYSRMTSVTIPDSVRKIDDEGFSHIANLVKINFVEHPTEILTLGKAAFSDCPLVTSLFIPDNIKEIPDSCFENNKSVTLVSTGELPIERYGKKAFKNVGDMNQWSLYMVKVLATNCVDTTHNFISLTLGGMNEVIEAYMFYGANTFSKRIDFLDYSNLKTINENAFIHPYLSIVDWTVTFQNKNYIKNDSVNNQIAKALSKVGVKSIQVSKNAGPDFLADPIWSNFGLSIAVRSY